MPLATRIAVGVIALACIAGCDKKELMKSEKGDLAVEVPWTWKKTTLDNDPDIGVCAGAEHACLVVLAESKLDFTDDYTLKMFADTVVGNMKADMQEAQQLSGPTDMTISDMPAIRHELVLKVDGLKFHYLHTSIEGKEAYFQILGWASPSDLERYREDLEAITQSFRVGAPAQ